MATQKALDALKKTKEAIAGIKRRLEPVLQKLDEDGFDDKAPQAQATVALSIGMMRYMGARLRGLDQGRKADDPLRKELNNIKRVLAEIKAKHSEKKPGVVYTTGDKSQAKMLSKNVETKDQPTVTTKTIDPFTSRNPTSNDRRQAPARNDSKNSSIIVDEEPKSKKQKTS